LATALSNTLAERHDLMAKALRLSWKFCSGLGHRTEAMRPTRRMSTYIRFGALVFEAAAMYPYNRALPIKKVARSRLVPTIFHRAMATVGWQQLAWDSAIMRMTQRGNGALMADAIYCLAGR